MLGCGGGDASSPDAARDDVRDAASDAAPPPPIPDPTTIAGPLTLQDWGTQPFLTPASIDEVLQSGFSLGRELFVAAWLPAPNAQRPNIDGLGPLHHATSCLACHPAAGRPRAFAGASVDVGILFRLVPPDPNYGGQLQPLGLGGVAGEAAITVTFDGVGKPAFQFATTGAQLAADAGARLSPQLAGMGLLEAVDDRALAALADPDDTNGDGISGRISTRGRFGWKAVQPTLVAQASAAFAGDLGISSSMHADDCTPAQTACLAAQNGGDPEIADGDLAATATFNRYLGVPRSRRENTDPQMVRGHAVFFTAGCASCHVPALTAGAGALPPLAGVTFYAYTDLLLHDMGTPLSDIAGEGDASPGEWRTPPLWGLGLVAQQADARFLHDGRAASLGDAIRWHGGEAERSRAAFAALSVDDTAALLAYLASL